MKMKIYLNISYLEEEMNSNSALKTVQPRFFTIQSIGQLHTVDNLSLLPISNYEGKNWILETFERNKNICQAQYLVKSLAIFSHEFAHSFSVRD